MWVHLASEKSKTQIQMQSNMMNNAEANVNATVKQDDETLLIRRVFIGERANSTLCFKMPDFVE